MTPCLPASFGRSELFFPPAHRHDAVHKHPKAEARDEPDAEANDGVEPAAAKKRRATAAPRKPSSPPAAIPRNMNPA